MVCCAELNTGSASVSVPVGGGGGGGWVTGGTITVSDAAPLMPSIVPWIDALPALCAVTTPAAVTVATPGLSEAHVVVLPVSTLPFESFATECAPAECPGA